MKTFSRPPVLRVCLVLLSLGMTCPGFAQWNAIPAEKITAADEAGWKKWLDNLYEMGVMVKGDSVFISEEVKEIAANPQLRQIIYPETYTWPFTQQLLKQMQVKIGLWHLINLYPENETNQEAVLQYVMSLDQAMDIEKALVSAFYTYIFFDPAASTMENGKPVIHHPDVMESKLAVVKEIATLIQSVRTMIVESKSKE